MADTGYEFSNFFELHAAARQLSLRFFFGTRRGRVASSFQSSRLRDSCRATGWLQEAVLPDVPDQGPSICALILPRDCEIDKYKEN